MTPDPKRPVTVEDLLHLKRSETPPTEFWTRFDQELRAKQLAAIVSTRPWWARFIRGFHFVSRYYAPLGAAAAFVAAAGGYHAYRVIAQRSPAAGDIPAATVAGLESGTSSYSELDEQAGSESRLPGENSRRAGAETVAYREVIQPGPSSLRPWSLVSRPNGRMEGIGSPAARSIEVSLAAARTAQPEIFRNLLSLSQRFDSQLVPERHRPPADPLSQIGQISLERRQRLLAEAIPVSAGPSRVSAPASDRIVRTLTDDRVYEEMDRRYRDSGSDLPSVSIKF